MNTPTLSPSPQSTAHKPNSPAWYRPIFSAEHGVYVVLLVSFLTGAAAAQNWTIATTLAFICAFCGFQAEHPLVLQIKQRRSFKPRFLVWGGLYATIALGIAIYLALQLPLLIWIYAGAIVAVTADAIAVFLREQKSILNELITFAAVCLSAIFAYAVTTETITATVIGLWLLNTLFFSSTIFTVKFRKDKTHSVIPSLLYHTIATLVVIALWQIGWLPPLTALAFSVVLLKFLLILWQNQWYCTTKIQFVAMLETNTALLFLTIVALSVLPLHVPL